MGERREELFFKENVSISSISLFFAEKSLAGKELLFNIINGIQGMVLVDFFACGSFSLFFFVVLDVYERHQ